MGCYFAKSDWTLLIDGLSQSQADAIPRSRSYVTPNDDNKNAFFQMSRMTQEMCHKQCDDKSFNYAALLDGSAREILFVIL